MARAEGIGAFLGFSPPAGGGSDGRAELLVAASGVEAATSNSGAAGGAEGVSGSVGEASTTVGEASTVGEGSLAAFCGAAVRFVSIGSERNRRHYITNMNM